MYNLKDCETISGCFFLRNIATREIKYYLLRDNISYVEALRFNKMRREKANEWIHQYAKIESEERLEATIHRLETLERNISELGRQCKQLNKLCQEDQEVIVNDFYSYLKALINSRNSVR